jgi:phage recombination protein Bet
MNQISIGSPNSLRDYNAPQLALIRRTVAKDATPDEFDMFVNVCRRVGLDPFRRQIYVLVYNKDDAEKRTCSFVVGIDGLRAIAERQGNYRPDEHEPEFTYDEKLKDKDSNPLGLEKAVVRAWKRDPAGDWQQMSAVAYWDEFAPLVDEWKEGESGRKAPTGRRVLGKKAKFWRDMPRQMLAKCAEAQVLRRGWPEDLSGIYSEDELDRAAASAEIEQQEIAERQALLGGPRMIFQFRHGDPLDAIPAGQVYDKIDAWLKTAAPGEVDWFRSINKNALQEFWAKDKGAALDLKKKMEAKVAEAVS